MCISYAHKVELNKKTIRGNRGGKVRPIRPLITNRNETRPDQAFLRSQSIRSNLIEIKPDVLITKQDKTNTPRLELVMFDRFPTKVVKFSIS